MRPRHGKKKSMDQIRNYGKDSTKFPLPSSTRLQTDVDLQQFSCCITLRCSIHDKIRKIEEAQKRVQKEYTQQMECLGEELAQKQAKNNEIRFEIEQLQRQTEEISADIDTIVSFAEKKVGKGKNKVKGTSKENIVKKEKSVVECRHQKTSSKFLRYAKPTLMV